eukprot:3181213-Prymnesium_polylepis.1
MAPPDAKEVEFTIMMPIMTTELSQMAMAPPFVPGPAYPLAIVRAPRSSSSAPPCTSRAGAVGCDGEGDGVADLKRRATQ